METSYYTSNFWKWRDAKKKTFVVSDVGDYSLFIKKNLENILFLRIRTRKSPWYEADQIIATDQGSVVYFKEYIGDVFKNGCIYPADIIRKAKRVTVASLEEAFANMLIQNGCISISEYLNRYTPIVLKPKPERRRCRRNKQLINQTQDGKQKNNKRDGKTGSRGYEECCL